MLQKRVGLPLGSQDIFVNVVGGLRITEPAIDLAVATAIASSFRDLAVPADLAIVGEVGLNGELRRVATSSAGWPRPPSSASGAAWSRSRS